MYCVCVFSLHRESPNMILGNEPLISEVVLSQLAASPLPQELVAIVRHV
jgi:hypothetical protein